MTIRCLRSPLRPCLAAMTAFMTAFALFGTADIAPPAQAQDNGSQTFTLNLRGAPVMAVVHALFQVGGGGQDYRYYSHVSDTVTTDVFLKNVSFGQALAAVLARADPPLTWSVSGESSSGKTVQVYHITFQQNPDPELEPASLDAADPLNIPEHSGPVPFSPAATGTGQRLTAALAVQVARAFCNRIGQPVTTPGAATYPAPAEGNADYTDFYWQPRWQVNFPGQATVQVVDATGIIADYVDNAQQAATLKRLTDKPTAGQHIVIRMTMPQRTAALLAKKALAATGQPEAGRLDMVRNWDLSEWTVEWDRAAQGIPYKNEYEGLYELAAVRINAHSGKISSLRFIYPFPPLPQGKVTISQDQAVQTARALLSADTSVPPDARCGAANLRIVRLSANMTKEAHAVWIVPFPYDIPGEERGHVDYIWVDAETGRVIADKHLREVGHFSEAGVLKGTPAAQDAEPPASTKKPIGP